MQALDIHSCRFRMNVLLGQRLRGDIDALVSVRARRTNGDGPMARVTMLGMGAMGSRMASSLLRGGHSVTVWNRTPERADPLLAAGATRGDTPRQAVAGAEFAISMVRDDDAAREVWLAPDTGALAGLGRNGVVVESSTVTPDWARELAESARTSGLAFLDAPVAGLRPQAEAGQLIFLVGGKAEVVARAQPVLQAMGGAIHHAGPAGSGATIKLAVNALLRVQIAAMAELIGWLGRSGLDPARAVEIITATPVASPAAKAAALGMFSGNFAPLFPVELVSKDLGYVAAMAAAVDAEIPIAAAATKVFEDAGRRGHDAEHATAVVQLYR
jgi:3-hydroxyisobutyrate dehydrogenase